MSDSVRPRRWQPIRLPCPWDFPGKSTGVGCHFLLQFMKVKSESEVSQSCPTLSNPMDCSPPGSSSMGFSRQEYWSGVPSPSLIHQHESAINLHMPPLSLTSLLPPSPHISFFILALLAQSGQIFMNFIELKKIIFGLVIFLYFFSFIYFIDFFPSNLLTS